MGRRVAVMGLLVVAIVLLVAAGVINLRGRRAAMMAHQPQIEILKDGELPGTTASPAPAGDSLIGKAAPSFALVDDTGKHVSLGDFKGRPVVVNFWATWCGPCKLEMPWLEEFSQKYKGNGLVILGLSQDDGMQADELASAARRIGVTYPILMQDSAAAKAYGGVDYLPETFYVSRAGVIVDETAGAPSKDQMQALIEKTIAAPAGGVARMESPVTAARPAAQQAVAE